MWFTALISELADFWVISQENVIKASFCGFMRHLQFNYRRCGRRN
jgi:hypothetical protein